MNCESFSSCSKVLFWTRWLKNTQLIEMQYKFLRKGFAKSKTLKSIQDNFILTNLLQKHGETKLAFF